MSLGASKIILKVSGIISIVFGILGIITGFAAVAGGTLIGAGAAEGHVATSSQLAIGVVLLGFGGLLIIIGSIIELLSGIFSVKASNDISKIMPAWWFSVLSAITSLISVISMFLQKTEPIKASNVLGAVVGLLTSILIFVAANTVKEAAGK